MYTTSVALHPANTLHRENTASMRVKTVYSLVTFPYLTSALLTAVIMKLVTIMVKPHITARATTNFLI